MRPGNVCYDPRIGRKKWETWPKNISPTDFNGNK